MKFSLDNYSNMPTPCHEPDWVTSETKRTLYRNVCKAFDQLKNVIMTGTKLAIKERRIVLRQIAKDSGVDASLLNKRRQPEINKLISEKNLELVELWNAASAKKYSHGKSLTKSEIHTKFRVQALEIERLTNLRLSDALTKAIENQMIDSHNSLVTVIDHLKAENAELQQRNAELNKQLRQLMKSLNTIKNK